MQIFCKRFLFCVVLILLSEAIAVCVLSELKRNVPSEASVLWCNDQGLHLLDLFKETSFT